MADIEYVSVLEDIKHLVLDDKLSFRGICTESKFDATVECCRAKKAEWKTIAQDMQQCIEWDVWLYYFLDYNNAEELVGFPGRIQVAGDGPRARQFELVEMRYPISQFKEHNIWKKEIEKLEKEEKRLRDDGKSEWKKLTRRYPDFEYIQRNRFADRVHQSFKDKAGNLRKGIVELGTELKRMEDDVKQELRDVNKQLKAMIEN
ncbi:hypothetical protein EAF00_011023 [Botryotinia globosa]|nr:hypothetical protein EAF00_011023 [Botryotinia globosa]